MNGDGYTPKNRFSENIKKTQNFGRLNLSFLFRINIFSSSVFSRIFVLQDDDFIHGLSMVYIK